MRSMSKKATIADQVLELLSDGDKWADEIVAGVSAQPVSIRMRLGQLVKQGVIVRVKRGVYRKKEVLEEPGATKNPRKHLDNVKLINLQLNMLDKVVDAFCANFEEVWRDETKLSELNGFILQFKSLASSVDKLMHRWYIVHRGYDANPYLAEADVERKVSAANVSGEPSAESHEIISWESEKETLEEAIARHEKKKKEGS